MFDFPIRCALQLTMIAANKIGDKVPCLKAEMWDLQFRAGVALRMREWH